MDHIKIQTNRLMIKSSCPEGVAPSTGGFYKEFEEEKKETTPERPRVPTSIDRTQESNDCPEELRLLQEGLWQRGLGEYLAFPKTFDHESKLLKTLEKLDVDDLRVILNDKGYVVFREMESLYHKKSVELIKKAFDRWVKDENPGSKVMGEFQPNVLVAQSVSKNHFRQPDFAIYGPDRVELDEDDGEESAEVRVVGKKAMNPHVVFQFGWKNKIAEERKALTDIMKYSGTDNPDDKKKKYAKLGRPIVGYLIKTIFKSIEGVEKVDRFDVYKVDQDNEISTNPTLQYSVDDINDVVIEVDPKDMGIIDTTKNLGSLKIHLNKFLPRLRRIDKDL